MTSTISRRRVLGAGASALAVATAGRALAQGLPKMRFSSAFTEQDPRADAYKAFGAAMKSDFEFQPFWGNTLFKQGTELVALQRGNLEMANLAPQDISKQLPAWSLLTSAYLFRDVAHLKKTFNSDVGRDFIKMARDELQIEVITPVYFGARHVNLKPDRTIKTPADLAGIKLRMPPGEVTTQFVLTGHVVGYDLLTVSSKAWSALKPDQQARLRSAAEKAIGDYTTSFEGKEKDVVAALKAEGKKVYTPDVAAFRTYAQKRYLDKYGRDWPPGALEKINAL
jgi:TRAP-type C4-dicarboxylate transport system substrate-binding protein